jgi:hypothetical protein
MFGSREDKVTDELWRDFLVNGYNTREHRLRRVFARLPGSSHRCLYCYAPFSGVGAPFARIFFDKRPSNLSPKFCNM